MRSGEFTVPNAQLATAAILDMLNGFSGWYRDAGQLHVDEIAEGYVDLAVGRILGATDQC